MWQVRGPCSWAWVYAGVYGLCSAGRKGSLVLQSTTWHAQAALFQARSA
jgi:hypothetical protein